MEKEIKMAARLYQCRDTAKSLCKMQGFDFKKTIVSYISIIKAVMKANNLDEIPALLKLSETKLYQENGMAQLMFMAAVAEIIEPSE